MATAIRRTPALAPALLTALSVLVAAPGADAGWPMLGHDPSRTSRGTGTSRLLRPVISWRYYLGGSVDTSNLLTRDVNGDGNGEILFISGGKILAKYPDDSLAWETAPLNLNVLRGVYDLNQDGTLDVVASGAPGLVAIFSGRDGHLEWRTNPTDWGSSIGSVRFADLDHNGSIEMYVSDADCGSVNERIDAMYVYDFTAGFGTGIDDGSHRVQLEGGRDYFCGEADALADMDGDGTPEIVAFSSQWAYLYNALTGAKIPAGGADPSGGYPLGYSVPYGVMDTRVVDVDGDGRQDVVGWSNNGYDPSINSRALAVFSYDPARPMDQRLYTRWIHNTPDVATDQHPYTLDEIADLDGDGHLEIVDTFVEGGTSTVYVFDAATGNVLATVPNQGLLGVVDAGGGTKPTVLLDNGTNITGYRFSAPPTAAAFATPAFTLPTGRLLFTRDEPRSATGSMVARALRVPLRGSNRVGIPIRSGSNVKLWDLAGATPAMLGSYDLPAGLNIVATSEETALVQPDSGLLLARSDGYLLVLDQQLAAINFSADPEFPQPGVRTGGFYSGFTGTGPVPLAAHFAAGAEPVIVVDGRTVMLDLDASRATLTTPPSVRWQWPGAARGTLVDTDRNGTDDLILAEEGTDMVARAPDGVTESMRVRVLNGAQGFYSDIVPLRTPTGMQYAAPFYDTGNGQSFAVGANATGVTFRTTPIVTAGSGQGSLTVDELDGDGFDDILFCQTPPMHVYSGADGHEIISGAPNYPVMTIKLPSPAGSVTHITGASYAGVAGLAINHPATAITQVWSSETSWHPTYVHGAVAQCPIGYTFADGELQSANVRVYDAASGTVMFDKVLADGRLFDNDAAAAAAGVVPGAVGNVTATEHLEGNRVAYLVGSTDGYLYAIDPCSQPPALIWSLYFRAPVGQAILGDSDGDGEDEIIVEAADGFVYGVDTEVLPAPTYVYDTDPTNGITDSDVDQTNDSQLSAVWADVPGATGYEWAVFTSGGTPVSRNMADPSNPFTPVPASTHSAQFGMSLRAGGHYFFAVRALGNGGSSAETTSDGTKLMPPTTMRDAGSGDAMADAGVRDAGARDAVADGAIDARNDAFSQPDTGFDTDDQPAAPSGCHCHAAGGSGHAHGPASAWGIALTGLLALLSRRQRAVARRGN